jgi:hypothetical protein
MSERPLNKRRRLTWRSKTGGGSLRATCPAVSPPWPMSGDLGHRWARSRTPWHWQADAPAPAQSRGPSRRGGPPHRWAPVCLPCGLAVLRLAGQPDSVPGLRTPSRRRHRRAWTPSPGTRRKDRARHERSGAGSTLWRRPKHGWHERAQPEPQPPRLRAIETRQHRPTSTPP